MKGKEVSREDRLTLEDAWLGQSGLALVTSILGGKRTEQEEGVTSLLCEV
jgi:hypothetical protein